MKKILALILALVMALSLVACGSKDDNDTPDDGKKTNTIKVGLICIGDENDQGYTYNFIRGKEAATEALAAKGINVEWVIKYNKGENDDCTNANIECAEEGCQLIINNSYGHEPFMLKVAGKSEYKDIQFIGCTNCGSRSDSLENTHNAFANIYEGRYVAGVVAGMKLQEMIDNGDITAEQAVIGYVGAFSFAEVISGFTAYSLGAKSVCPSVTMKVQFVGSWSDATEEANAASALCDAGCVMISQHSDNTTPATMAQTKGAFHTGYNNDMTGVAPDASLIGTRIDWAPYFEYAIETVYNGGTIDQDWCKGIADGSVVMTTLNEKICAKGTAEKVSVAIRLPSAPMWSMWWCSPRPTPCRCLWRWVTRSRISTRTSTIPTSSTGSSSLLPGRTRALPQNPMTRSTPAWWCTPAAPPAPPRA